MSRISIATHVFRGCFVVHEKGGISTPETLRMAVGLVAAGLWSALLVCLGSTTTHAAIGDPVTVCIADGCLTGTTLAGDVSSFLGIPYAAPPTGDLRFRPPVDPVPWGPDPRSATTFGPTCPRLTGETVSGSEDCLALDVWAPATGASHPVMVFIHPGLNSRGTARSGTAIYDGLTFTTTWDGQPWAATQGIVFVSVEWRVNAFGFLAHPALSAEDPNGSSGNFGVLDQIKALQWVKTNIDAFGGDPSNVTILGATAGGADASVLLVSDLAAGLFSRAILESPVWSRFPTLQQAEQGVSARIVQNVGCASAADVPACLRAKSMADILAATPFESPATESTDYAPRIDGWLLKGDPIDLVEGDLAPSKVPVLIGSTADEINAHALDSDLLSTIGLSANAAVEDYEAALATRFGPSVAAQVFPLYDPAQSEFAQSPLLQLGLSAPVAAMLRVLTDWELTCPARAFARNASTGGRDVYRYFFTHAVENQDVIHRLGAFDNEDNWFLFRVAPYTLATDEQALRDAMRAYWGAFAATGNPNGGARIAWPVYDHAQHSDNYLAIDMTMITGDGVRTVQCDFWNALDRKIHGEP